MQKRHHLLTLMSFQSLRISYFLFSLWIKITFLTLHFILFETKTNIILIHVKYRYQVLFSETCIVVNVSWASNHHIKMISDGSYDTEDWSNDAESSALTSHE